VQEVLNAPLRRQNNEISRLTGGGDGGDLLLLVVLVGC
jgi:hypothetical protein